MAKTRRSGRELNEQLAAQLLCHAGRTQHLLRGGVIEKIPAELFVVVRTVEAGVVAAEAQGGFVRGDLLAPPDIRAL